MLFTRFDLDNWTPFVITNISESVNPKTIEMLGLNKEIKEAI
jgi:hypothetical protein